jgi:Tfp pilus assembly protein PilO
MTAVGTKNLKSALPRSSAVTATLALGALCYVLLIFLPAQRSISALRRELREKQQHVLQSDRLTIPMSQSEDKLRVVADFTRREKDHLPSANELIKSLGLISEQAKLAGVTVRRFDPQPVTHLETLQVLPVELSLEGTYLQVFELIQRIEKLPLVIWVKRMHVGEIEGKPGSLTTELTLTIFGEFSEQADSAGSNVR